MLCGAGSGDQRHCQKLVSVLGHGQVKYAHLTKFKLSYRVACLLAITEFQSLRLGPLSFEKIQLLTPLALRDD
jgi:hypothetical protein